MSLFKKATKKKSRLRMTVDGPTGAGKTFTALRFAFAFKSEDTKVAVLNTETGAVEKYLGLAPDGIPWEFDICTLEDFSPSAYTEAILAAGAAGYDVLIIDSLTHAWSGSGGALELKDKAADEDRNSWAAWRKVNPLHNRMIEAIVRSPCHVITTMRSKMEYVQEDAANGRKVIRKLGMAPVQRAGVEYEFDVVCDLDTDHFLKVSKSRCPDVDGAESCKPGLGFMAPIINWLEDGTEVDPSYYAVNETDLQKIERRKTEGLSSDEKMQRAKERMKQQQTASSQKASDPPAAEQKPETPETVEPTAPRPETDEPPLLKSTMDEIVKLMKELISDPQDMAPFLNREGVGRVSQLTEPAGQRVLANLKKLQAEKLKAASDATADDDTGMPCSPGQLDEIVCVVKASGWPRKNQEEFLQSKGVERFEQLTAEQAEQVIEKLRPIAQKNATKAKSASDENTSKETEGQEQAVPS